MTFWPSSNFCAGGGWKGTLHLSTIQSYAWTLELLGEALVQHDEMLECEHNPRLSFRNTAGIHQAIRIISRLASEQCGKVMERSEQDLER